MSYKIKAGQQSQATKLKVSLKPSTVKGKKVSVFKNGKKVADIGAKGYRDFHTIKAKDREEAEKAKKAYRARHGCDKDPRRNTPQFYSCEILWNE